MRAESEHTPTAMFLQKAVYKFSDRSSFFADLSSSMYKGARNWQDFNSTYKTSLPVTNNLNFLVLRSTNKQMEMLVFEEKG